MKGLLYAATDTQVWVSFDDGDHWQSLRLDMPAISVRDLQVKDDAAVSAPISIAGTHGRGFWILDDVTPLRQTRRAAAGRERVAYLFKPATGGARALRRRTIRRRGRRSSRRARIRRRARSIDYYLALRGARHGRSSRSSNARGARGAHVHERRSCAQSRSGARSRGVQRASASRIRRRRDCGLPLYWPRADCRAPDARPACIA